MAKSWRRAVIVGLVAAGVLSSCTRIYNDRATTTNNPIAPTASPTPAPASASDLIEYRIFGNVGAAVPVTIKYTNTVDGLTLASAASLPYVASVRSSESSIFLWLEATATPSILYTTANLQVQIYVNGRLFREGFASGFSTLTATATGTYRR